MLASIPGYRIAVQARRRLLRSPGYSFAVVAVLALGIGAVTAIFSVVYGVLLRPYGFAGENRVVVVHETMREMAATMPLLPVNYLHFAHMEARSRTLEAAAVVRPRSVSVSLGREHPEMVPDLLVSGDFFRVLGREPALGRAFRPDEFKAGRSGEAVLSWAAAQRFFGPGRGGSTGGAAAAAVGQQLQIDGKAVTVVGVLPASFHLPAVSVMPGERVSNALPYGVYTPFVPSDNDLTSELGDFNYIGLARLRPGVTREAAEAELDGVVKAEMAAAHQTLHLGVRLESFGEEITGGSRGLLLLLLAAVSGVLLIGCVNLANLQLARSVSFAGEQAVRAALGATRGQLLREALAENLLLAIAGGAAAVLVAEGGVRLLVALAPPGLPRLGEVGLSLPVLGVAAALSLVTSLAFGLLPAWRASAADPLHALRASGSRTAGEGRGAGRVRRGLLVAEIACSLVLLVVTGTVARSFGHLLSSARGVGTEPVTMAQADLSEVKYVGDGAFTTDGNDAPSRARSAAIERTVAKLQALPGVTSVGVTSVLPLTGDSEVDGVRRPDHPLAYAETPLANMRQISPGYFSALGIPIVAGRGFTDADRSNTRVVIVSERTAKAVWPGENPVGRTIEKWDRVYTVVGVAADARLNDPKRDVGMFYLPFWDYPPFSPVFLVRGSGTSGPEIREALWSVDPQVAIPTVLPLTVQTNRALAVERFQALLIGCFGLAGLLLAALGVYGVLGYGVTVRMREWGLRMALGSSREQLRWRVLLDAGRPALAGALVGIAGAVLAVRVVGAMLYGGGEATSPASQAPVLAGALGVLGATVLLAALPSARRAARAEPAETLRGE